MKVAKAWSVAVVAALLIIQTACAPMLQRAARPEAGFTGPRLENRAFVSFDGARLGLTRWDAQGPAPPWAVIVGVHGMDDYANAFHLAAPWWAARGVTTYAFDQRGFGRSPGRGLWAPDALRIEDLRTLVALVRRRHPGALVAVVGESLGGAVAIEAFASARPPDADRLILAAPAVWGWTTQPLLYRIVLWIAAHVAPGKVFTPPVWLTDHVAASDNREELIAMGRDPLMTWGARTDALYGLVNTMQNAERDMNRLRAPTLYLYGAHDQIIPRSATRAAVRRLPPSDRTAFYPDGWHLLLRDRQASRVWADTLAFVRDPAAPLPSGAGVVSEKLRE
jgi:alpha-beta hydrolase superfamily lysophospholipase